MSKSLFGVAKEVVDNGLLTESEAIEQQGLAKNNNISFTRQVVSENLVDPAIIALLSSYEFGIPFFDLKAFNVKNTPKINVKSKAISNAEVIPLYKRGNRLFVAISDTSNLNVLDTIKFQTGLYPEPVIVEDDKLVNFIKDSARTSVYDDASADKIDDNDLDNTDSEDAPIIRYVNKILLDAIAAKVSDIHFEPYEKMYRIRFRQDGILREHAKPPNNLANRLATRLKVMSLLDISERRLPQDGRFKMKISEHQDIDFRVSTCPTLFGEKVVMRILDPTSAKLGIDALGYEAFQKEIFMKNIHKSQGMVLATGPTGSGKTVSLYTALNILNTIKTNISTCEDPVEINLPGINQVTINPKAGLDFSTTLRSFLRQDPDILMVGEIRDLDTAEIAIKAAQTGHMVLSTLHTNSAADTLMRLMNMGIPAFNLATSISLVMAQRLCRRLCDKCKKKTEIPEHALLEIGFKEEEINSGKLEIFDANGCSSCQNGYSGRIGIYEMMEVTTKIGEIIMDGGSAIDVANQAMKDGMWTLREAGLNKIRSGLTSVEEILRVTKE